MTLRLSLFMLLFLLFFGCKKVEKEPNLTKIINSEISNNPAILKMLTNGYEFKYSEGGIGRDFAKPIYNDSIVILKNSSTQHLDISKINYGKTILIDSVALCNLSHAYDLKNQIIRSFLQVISLNTSKQYKLELKNWVPQYIDDTYKCVEFDY